MGSIPTGNSDFFFVPRSWHGDQFTFNNIIFCSQKRGGRLYINDNEVNDLGVYRNITGFVPQVGFFFLLVCFAPLHLVWVHGLWFS